VSTILGGECERVPSPSSFTLNLKPSRLNPSI